jgi:hypothetical protein
VKSVLANFARFPPKRLARQLGEVARDALPCIAATVFDGNPVDGLTVGLRVEANERPDVLDLARVLETEPHGHVLSGWALLHPNRRHPYSRLLLGVQFDRPVTCVFSVRFDVHDQPTDPTRAALPLLLAASGFALICNESSANKPVTWIPAPASRDCILKTLAELRV